jgi:hypothetical protein
VAFSGVFFGALMLIWNRRRPIGNGTKAAPLLFDSLTWSFAGLWLGMWTVFDWQIFRRPLVYITIIAVAGWLCFSRVAAIKRRDSLREHQM